MISLSYRVIGVATALGALSLTSGCLDAPTNHSEVVMTTHSTLQRQWMMVAFPGYNKDDLTRVGAQMSMDDGQSYSANMGCNQLGGRYKSGDDQHIAFSHGFSTRMACPDDMSMRLEQDFGAILPSLTYYAVDGHKLTLATDSGETVEFIAADWD